MSTYYEIEIDDSGKLQRVYIVGRMRDINDRYTEEDKQALAIILRGSNEPASSD